MELGILRRAAPALRRLFQTLARASDREDARAVCTRIALGEPGTLARLRTVIP